jgi:hypothetical protein
MATIDIGRPVPPDYYPEINPQQKRVSPVATAVAGVIGGALAGAGVVMSRKLEQNDDATPPEE